MNGRNLPCPCGSGKKYKRCHGQEEQSVRAIPRQQINGPAVVCCMPTRGSICIETVQSLSHLDRLNVTMRSVARKPVDVARNELWRMATEAVGNLHFTPLGGWFALWIDDDAYWRDGTLTKALQTLYDHPEIDILAGWFGPRSANAGPAVRLQDGSWPRPGTTCEWGDVVQVHRSGFHFVLHRAALLNEMPSNPFSLESGDEGEDAAFCRRARAAGKTIYVHTGLPIGHIDQDGAAYLPGEPPYKIVDGQYLKDDQPQIRSYGDAVDRVFVTK